jgi:hypothetical protein
MLDGWAGLDEVGGADKALPDPHAPDQIDLVDKLYVEAFNTPAGRQLLAFWKHTKLNAPVCVPGAGAEVGFHREGENSLVRECLQRLTRGLTPKT